MRALPVALLALLAIALLPPAAADHVYTHRYVVIAHVAGPDGAPIANATVDVTWDFGAENHCGGLPTFFGADLPASRGTTDARGLAVLCTHAHALDADDRLTVRVGEAAETLAVDPAARFTLVRASWAQGAAGAPAEVLVHARLWRAGAATIEGVPAEGHALAEAPANVTVRFADGSARTAATASDRYGDLLVALPRVAAPTNATIEGPWGAFELAFDAAGAFASGVGPDPSPSPSRAEFRIGEADAPAPTPLPLLAAAAALALAAGTSRRRRRV